MNKYTTRFWRRVQKGPNCWNWVGRVHKGGRGIIWIGRKPIYAHRFAYELFVGLIPKGLYVCHTCDNPICVNPNHLFTGTQDDNMKDMKAKGRENHPEGEENGRAKLTDDDVRYIRLNYRFRSKRGFDIKGLAKMFNVCTLTVWEVLHRRKWAHVQ